MILLSPLPFIDAIEIEHAYDEVTTTESYTGSSSWLTISDLSLTSGNFTAGEEYLIIASAQVSGDTVGGSYQIRTERNGNQWAASKLGFDQASTDSWVPYVWFYKWTAEASQDVTMEFRPITTTHTIYADQMSLTAINLNDLTENTDYYYVNRSTDDALTTSWTATNPSITFTPNGSDDWLIIGEQQLDPASTIQNLESRLNLDDTTFTNFVTQEGDNNNQDKMQHTFFKVVTPTNAEHTWELEARNDAGSTGLRLDGTLFMINMELFADHADAFVANDSSQDSNDTLATSPTQENTATIVPSSSGDFIIFNYGIYDPGAAGIGTKARSQVANSDQVPTQTADNYILGATWDADDNLPLPFPVTIESLSASTTIDLDTSNAAGNEDLNDLQIVSFSMELANAIININVSETLNEIDSQTVSGAETININVSELLHEIDSQTVSGAGTFNINVSELLHEIDSQTVSRDGTFNISVSEIQHIIDSDTVINDGAFVPSGKYIWFNCSLASNSTQGCIYAFFCPAGQFVNGFWENGTASCSTP